MWTYDTARNRKSNPWYMRADRPQLLYFDGEEITSAMVFDEVRITCDPESDSVGEAHVYTSGEMVAQVGGNRGSGTMRTYTFRDDEPEVIEIRRRLAAGTCIRTYYDSRDHPVPEDKEFHSAHWLMELRHPFHTDNRHLFFEHFTRNLEYQPRTLHGEQVFRVPGIWLDANPAFREVVMYKRADSHPSAPAAPYEGDYAAMMDAFAAQGWTVPMPIGFKQLYRYHQAFGEMADGSPWWDPGIVLAETGIELAWPSIVRQLASIYRTWEVENRAQTGNAYDVTREWWKTWLGYAWELVQGTGSLSIRVHAADRNSQRTITGREAVTKWAIAHLMAWAQRGIDDFRSSVNPGIIEAVLDEPSLTHVLTTGGFGETLVGLVDDADWARYQGRTYRTVANVVSTVTAEAGADLSVNSGNTITLQGEETILDAFGDTTYLWELVDGEGAALSATDALRPTLTAPTLEPEADDVTLVYRLTVTNDGVSDVDEVSVRVIAPNTVVNANAGPDLTVAVNGTVEIVGTATYENQVGDSAYRWEKVSGDGTIDDPDSNSPEFTAPATPGTTVYQVTVTNNGVSDTDTVTITITAA